MSELQNNKKLIERELGELSSDLVLTAKKIKEAESAGDKEKAFSLREQGLVLDREAERLQSEYDLLQEQEAKPELERIGKLTKELEKTGFGAYSPIGGVTISNDPNPPTKERQRELVAEIYKAPVGEGGMAAEQLPTGLMAQVASLPNPTSKAQLLENTFGKGNVLPVNIGGNLEFFIKQPDGGVKTTLDKGIAGLAGIAVEAPVVAAEIASFLGISAATKSPALAVAGSATVGGVVGTGIDEALRLTYGLPSDLGGTMARRGTQAVIGTALGGVTDVAIPAMRAARIENPFANKFALELEGAAERLMTSEQKLAAKQGRKAGEIQVPMGAKLAGQQGVEMQSELAGTYAKSNITSAALKTQESLIRLFDNFKSKASATPSDFANIAAQKEAQRNALSGNIASLTGRDKRIVAAALDRQTKGALSDIDELGDILRVEIKNAEDQAIKSTTEQYDVLEDVANRAGFSISAKELLGLLPRIKGKVNIGGAFDESAVKSVESRLRALAVDENKIASIQKRIDGEKDPEVIRNLSDQIESIRNNDKLDFRAFDAYIRAFNDARPDNAVGGKTKDVFGSGVSAELSKLRRDIYSRFEAVNPNGTVSNLGDEFQLATDRVKARGAFEKNTLGGILREAAGEQATTPRDIVNSVLKEPYTVQRVTQALRELGAANPQKAGEADKMLGLLQLQYMNNIGVGRGGGGKVQVDDGMLEALFGKQAAAQKRSIDEINRNIGDIKGLDKSKLSFDDLQKMGQPLSDNERKSLAKSITKRLQAEKEEERLINSSIFKLAKKGNFENIDPDVISKAILSPSSTTTDAIVAMRELSKASLEARNLYKGDFRRELLDQFAGGTPTANAPFETLFDTKKFISAYKSPNETGKTAFAKKLEIVLGKEEAQKLYDIARLYEANIIANTSAPGFNPRFTATNKGVILGLPIGQMGLSTKNRFITGMLSSDSQRNALMIALKNGLSKTAMPGAVNDVYNKMAKEMFLTRTGLTALAHQASSDPEFSAEITNMAKEFNEKQGLDLGGN